MQRFFWVTLALAACETRPAPRPEPAQGSSSAIRAPSRPLEFIRITPGAEPVDAIVQRESREAAAYGQHLVVYVGATWCEPCQRFHRAVEEGKMNALLPPTRFLEFDLDQDGERLKAAGYRSRYIPLFALPSSDGRGSGKQIEGSIKGEGAVAEITPRLRKLLGER